MNLPGIGVLVGGMWVANVYYWGFNQYIIQRTLAAKSLKESQRGILFAAGLKLILPLIVMIPGIAAYAAARDAGVMASLGEPRPASRPPVAHPGCTTRGCRGSCRPAQGPGAAALAAPSCLAGVDAQQHLDHLHHGHFKAHIQPEDADDTAHGADGPHFGGCGRWPLCDGALLGGIDRLFQFVQVRVW